MSDAPTEAYVVTWRRKSGPALEKSHPCGFADVGLFLSRAEAEMFCKDCNDARSPGLIDLGATHEVRKVLVTFVEEE